MDLRLAESSPAIDSADSGAVGFAMKDCEGFMPADAPGAPNIGQGPSAFADRGAFEWDPPPTPSLYLTPANGEINLTITADASGSIDPDDRPIDTYTFDFGDGTVMGPMTHSACPHTYTMPGTYPVLVTVTDTAGKKSIAGSTVTALDHPPGARVAVTPSFGMVDLPVVADASASRGTELTPIASYMFDFGDGSVIGPQPDPICNHTFTSAGEYTVLVTVTNASGASTTASQTVTVMDEAPTATLNVTPKLGIIGLIVTADASGSSDADSTRIVSYMFEFGDGTVVGPQSSPLTSHTYVADGEFTVRVSVSDSAGNVGQTSTSVRVVSNSAPQAALSVAFAVGRKPFGVVADASRSTDTDPAPIASYTFDFGDGTIVGPQSSPTALHIYRKKGYHTISVTVTDTAGLSSRASAAILVKKKHRK
jgi:PKD repeat protein